MTEFLNRHYINYDNQQDIVVFVFILTTILLALWIGFSTYRNSNIQDTYTIRSETEIATYTPDI